MNRHQVAGKWDELKGKVKEKWGQLTDDELAESEGKMDQLAGKIQQKYGGTREDIQRQLEQL